MKVAIIFDGPAALGRTPDVAILGSVEAVEAALAQDGHEAVRVPVDPDGRWVERLRRARVDLVFNLCEGIDGLGAYEPAVIGALDLLGIPYTGASAWTAAICLRKHVLNAHLRTAGLPVPRFGVARRGGPLPVIGFPAICKPAAEDASLGVEQRSVVRSAGELADRVADMHQRWDEVLVQRYVDGREVNVGIVGDQVLPIAEIDFGRMPRGKWRIVTYRSKWEDGCDEDVGALPTCPADLPEPLVLELERIALAAWRLVGGTGYGRCDFRVDRAGRPWLLEVNANPDISPHAGLARMARVAGLDYAALVRRVCESAAQRGESLPADRWALTQRLSGVARG
jgi:D-alanine-D-alanine ligase